MAPLQLGIGVPNACERLLHALEARLEAAPEEGVLLLECKNALNLISRVAARAFIDRGFPSLSPHVAATYGCSTAGAGRATAATVGGATRTPPAWSTMTTTPTRPSGCPPPPLDGCSPSSEGRSRGTPWGPFCTPPR